MKRVFITPNIQPTEETLDMSCFLSAVDKEDEEVPELVEGDEMDEEDEMDEDDEDLPDEMDDEELLA